MPFNCFSKAVGALKTDHRRHPHTAATAQVTVQSCPDGAEGTPQAVRQFTFTGHTGPGGRTANPRSPAPEQQCSGAVRPVRRPRSITGRGQGHPHFSPEGAVTRTSGVLGTSAQPRGRAQDLPAA